MKVVVCDDDPTVRGVVSSMAASAGLDVIAETDNASDAVSLADRFKADLVVLDLSLPWGTGRDALDELRARQVPCQIVVFTAYAGEEKALLAAGALAVIEKPNFPALDAVFHDLVAESDTAAEHERRRPNPPRPEVPPPGRCTVSGVEEPAGFGAALDAADRRDCLLVVAATEEQPDPRGWWGVLRASDRSLALARALRRTVRVQDRVSQDEEGLVLAMLVNGGTVAPAPVFARLERAAKEAGLVGAVSAGWAVPLGGEHGHGALARARTACERSIGGPPGERLWAG